MKRKIYIHNNHDAKRIERNSYYGGRTECFRLGELSGGPFYKLDVNSMYPYVMEHERVPTRLIRVWHRPTMRGFKRDMKRWGAVAKVTIETNEPAYPFRTKTGLIYPVGRFRVYLPDPELRYALSQNHIKDVHRVTWYDTAVIFREFVRTLYKLRQKYKKHGNKTFEQMLKYVMNGLYGKWGQRNEQWKRLGYNADSVDNVYVICDENTGKMFTRYVLAGWTYELTGHSDARHSFHAISSWITSAARVYLWALINKAGRKNVFYCDTDSLVVNVRGYRNLKETLDETKLGGLKLEYKTKQLCIHGPKDYKTTMEEHIKGVPDSWERLSENSFTGWKWEGIRGALRSGNMDRVIMTRMDKVLCRNYSKGQVSSSGLVSPFILDGETADSRA